MLMNTQMCLNEWTISCKWLNKYVLLNKHTYGYKISDMHWYIRVLDGYGERISDMRWYIRVLDGCGERISDMHWYVRVPVLDGCGKE